MLLGGGLIVALRWDECDVTLPNARTRLCGFDELVGFHWPGGRVSRDDWEGDGCES